MESILSDIELFCKREVVPFLESCKGTPTYPSDIIKKMGDIGLFGINIPELYDGAKVPISLNLNINRTLAKYWLALPALCGTHLRANQYFVKLATDEQKEHYLPKMASGEFIAAHAFHEKAIRNPLEFKTEIVEKNGKYFLSGTKEWVTNADNCAFMIVVARRTDHNGLCSAAIVRKDMPGVNLAQEHYRRGIHGISLTRVTFSNVELEEEDFIGGSSINAFDFISSYRAISSLNFSARAAGIAESIVDKVKPYLMLSDRDDLAKGVIFYKWSEIQMIKESIISYFERSVTLNKDNKLTKPQAHRTKVFCSQYLQTLVSKASMLCGGTGYASEDYLLIQQLGDAGSLALIDTPNDILLTWSGRDELHGE